MAFANHTDVATRLGRDLTESETLQAIAYLDDVEAEIRARITDLDSRVDDTNYLALVVRVEATAAKRVFLNPGGIRQHAESLDDYSQSDTFDTAISAGSLYVSADEWQLLGAGSSSAGSFSMALGYPD